MSDTRSEYQVRKILDRIRESSFYQAAQARMRLTPCRDEDKFSIVVSDNIWEMLINDMNVLYKGGHYPIEVKWVDDIPQMQIFGIPVTMSKDLILSEIRFRAEVEI